MKLFSQKRHAIDFLFPVTVFFVFTISALTVILLAARIYQSTTDDSQRNYTPVSYTHLRAHETVY